MTTKNGRIQAVTPVPLSLLIGSAWSGNGSIRPSTLLVELIHRG